MTDQSVDLELADRIAGAALSRYALPDGTRAELINVSENATYLISAPDTDYRAALRVHRMNYHPPGAIESELDWLRALRADKIVPTPEVLRTTDGHEVIEVADPAGRGSRQVVMFEWLPGREPDPDDLTRDFEELGAITARLHEHARRWVPPTGFNRFSWSYDDAFGATARWGRWQDGVGVGPAERAVLDRLDATLQRRLAAFGSGPDRWGLIHADLRLANLLVQPGLPTSVIDFDDCGFGWYLYDLGSALSFIEHEPFVPGLIDAWTTGYRTVTPMSTAEEHELQTFVMFRRLLLVAWIGSHSHADIAQQLGARYTKGSCDLAEAYLSAYA